MTYLYKNLLSHPWGNLKVVRIAILVEVMLIALLAFFTFGVSLEGGQLLFASYFIVFAIIGPTILMSTTGIMGDLFTLGIIDVMVCSSIILIIGELT